MKELTKVNDNIYRLVTPYKDIWTTVYFIKTEKGTVIFDTASAESDADQYILPALAEIGVPTSEVKYIFISHKHRDHAGGLEKLVRQMPWVKIISRSDKLKEEYGDRVYCPQDGYVFAECLRTVTIPGHTIDSAAVYDERTKTLITGDCLQVYGIFGSGDWGSNITYVPEHFEAVEKLKKMDIAEIYTAHDYHPIGYRFVGREQIDQALDGCTASLLEIKRIISENGEKDDEWIRNAYNTSAELPTVSVSVVAAVRKAAAEGKI